MFKWPVLLVGTIPEPGESKLMSLSSKQCLSEDQVYQGTNIACQNSLSVTYTCRFNHEKTKPNLLGSKNRNKLRWAACTSLLHCLISLC